MYEVPREKRCSRCGAQKLADEFFPAPASRVGLSSRCRSCHREDVAEYRERLRARNRAQTTEPTGQKRCSDCRRTRPRADFRANASTTDGLAWQCRECARRRERRNARSLRGCTKCGRDLPRSAFHRDRRSADGLQSWCKECLAKANRERRERNRQRNAEREPDLSLRKRCPSCGRELAGSEFHRNRTTIDGLHWVCKACNTSGHGNRERQQYRERLRVLKGYGIERDELQRMLAAQNHSCAICHQPFERVPSIDHDHRTGRVRGLLCQKCNTGLGLFGDDPHRLRRAISYLRPNGDRYARPPSGP